MLEASGYPKRTGLLIGQPTLARQLRMGTFAALDQRTATRYAIKPMDLAESAAYLRAGGDAEGISDADAGG